ncbi:hypothetical protein [Streptococcus plurextorum]|nr:hypothetical protein [Streptococcus plurextorum]
MKKYHIYLISALILIAFGVLSRKLIFVGLGSTFVLMAIAEFLKKQG